MAHTHAIREVTVRHSTGAALEVEAGQRVTVTNVDGGQVADTWAFVRDSSTADCRESLSVAHTRAHVERLFPRVGESFVTDRRRPILRLETDHSPGIHDLLIPACDPTRYEQLGAPDHRSCQENLHQALEEGGWSHPVTPQPVNLFMNTPFLPQGELQWLPCEAAPGDCVTFTALLDLVFVASACPQDITAINATQGDLLISVVSDTTDERGKV